MFKKLTMVTVGWFLAMAAITAISAQEQTRKTVQYATIGHKDATWKCLHDKLPRQVRDRRAIQGSEVKVYVNDGKEPVLVVTDMRHGESKGTVGVWGWNSYFANFKFTPTATTAK